MSYKDEIRESIKAGAEEGSEVSSKIGKLVKQLYEKALKEASLTGRSIESITYEILEGIEEGLQNSQKRSEEILKDSVEVMTDTIYQIARENIEKDNTEANLAKKRFEETIEREKENLLEAMDAFKSYAKDKSYQHLSKDLHLNKSKVTQWIKTLGRKVS